ncbi:MAG: AAA family ATPase [Sphingobium sp.]|nr:AAA family ATPase [Sphingobium sp.]MCP5399032.1 AAA family ATPase [Sphingomonas sp.]
MGKEDFPGRKPEPNPKGLLERAAEVFDFDRALKGGSLPPLDIPADLIPPAPEPKAEPAPAPAEFAPVPEPVSFKPATAAPEPVAAPAAPRARDWAGPVHTIDRDAMAEAGHLVPGGPVSGLGEEFRIIKREILARIRGAHNKQAIPNGNVILVSSTHSGDGKTYCAVNLAVSLAAESDVEVLLVDADFAQPGVMSALGIENGKGLMDALVDPSIRVEDLVMRTDVPSLFLLPAGDASHNDAEYLASSRTEALIASLVSGRPDRIVIFDSPPLLEASVASVLASHVGQTVLVVRADRTTETALRDAAELLNGCANIQLLLNGVKFSASGRRFGTYYGKEDGAA